VKTTWESLYFYAIPYSLQAEASLGILGSLFSELYLYTVHWDIILHTNTKRKKQEICCKNNKLKINPGDDSCLGGISRGFFLYIFSGQQIKVRVG